MDAQRRLALHLAALSAAAACALFLSHQSRADPVAELDQVLAASPICTSPR